MKWRRSYVIVVNVGGVELCREVNAEMVASGHAVTYMAADDDS